MELIGYFASLLIGISLGLLGGGGSILTVPVMVYLFGVDPVLAAAYSLFVVGISSLFGAVGKIKRHEVNLRMAVLFGAPSMLMVFLTRKFIIPQIPDILFTGSMLEIAKSDFLMLLFALLMLFAGKSMMKPRKEADLSEDAHSLPFWLIPVMGLVEGSVTGLVGAGGGFIIIPALVLFCHVPMKMAVGSSLLIISVKSLVGFTGDVSNYTIDWNLLLIVSALAVLGIFIGNKLSQKIEAAKLKKGFAWFVLAMAAWILIKLFLI
ncbi:MAG: sulfite exporter TauE/SafE family protein [Bacteroidetes bacterium]|nr:MAG: sulfite exporter TauE/SafE family protein [Bacteroidota bacterium]